MFRHKGKTRTAAHNLKLASLLSCVAGMVNVTGFFVVGRLTTNVTGHFAFFADEIILKRFDNSFVFFMYFFSFLVGAFFSNLSIEYVSRRKERFNNFFPILTESAILFFVAWNTPQFLIEYRDIVVCALLFAMGMQNALVTNISNSIVRTTHLTGLFTDLGIELSQLFFYKDKDRNKLKSIIKLRIVIILFFFIGSIIGGFGYLWVETRILFLAIIGLLGGLYYDAIKFRILSITRKLGQIS